MESRWAAACQSGTRTGGFGIVLAAGGTVALVFCVRALVRSLRLHQIRLLAPHDDLSDEQRTPR